MCFEGGEFHVECLHLVTYLGSPQMHSGDPWEMSPHFEEENFTLKRQPAQTDGWLPRAGVGEWGLSV